MWKLMCFGKTYQFMIFYFCFEKNKNIYYVLKNGEAFILGIGKIR